MKPQFPPPPETPSNGSDGSRREQSDTRPRPPRKPELEDCCRSGCIPCVFDLYDSAIERYELALAAWQLRHPGAD